MQIDWTAVLGRFALGVGIVSVVAVLGALAFGMRSNEVYVALENGRLRIGFEGAPGAKSKQPGEGQQDVKQSREPGKAPEQDGLRTIYQVVGVDHDDTLAVRIAADPFSRALAEIPPNGKGILGTGRQRRYGRDTWLEVRWKSVTGWVNGYYLQSLVPDASNGRDRRIL